MFRWFVPSLICFAAATFAVDVSASILLPKTFEYSVEDAARAIEIQILGKSESKTSQTGNGRHNSASRSTPFPPLSEIRREGHFAFAAMHGSGSSSSTTGGGTVPVGSGNGVPAISPEIGLQFDSALVGRLSRSK